MAGGTELGRFEFTFGGDNKELVKSTEGSKKVLKSLHKQAKLIFGEIGKEATKSAKTVQTAAEKQKQAVIGFQKARERVAKKMAVKGGASHGATFAQAGKIRAQRMRSQAGGAGGGGGKVGAGALAGASGGGMGGFTMMAAAAAGAVVAFKAAQVALVALKNSLIVSVEVAANFERGFQVVKAITSGTSDQFKELERDIVNVSKASEHASGKLIKAAEVLGRAGFQADKIGPALKTVGDLATAGGISVGNAAELSVRMLKSFGKELSDLPQVANMLATASANANVSISSLAEGFKFTGAIAETVGLKFSDVTTALSLLGETGLEAGLAGRALQAMIMDLANPTDQAKDKLFEMGVHTHTAAGKMLPLKTILGQLSAAGMSASDAFTIFNRNSARAVTALVRNVDKYAEFQQITEDTDDALRKQSDTIRDSFNVQTDRMRNNIEALSKKIGDSFLPVLTKLSEVLADIVGFLEGINFSPFINGMKNLVSLVERLGPMGFQQLIVDLAKLGTGGLQGLMSGGGVNKFDPSNPFGRQMTMAPQLGAGTGAFGQFQGSQEDAGLLDSKKARADKLADLLDPTTQMKKGIEAFSRKFTLVMLEGEDAVAKFNVGKTLRTISQTLFTDLEAEAGISSKEAFEAIKATFAKMKGHAEVLKVTEQQAWDSWMETVDALNKADALQKVKEVNQGVDNFVNARAAAREAQIDLLVEMELLYQELEEKFNKGLTDVTDNFVGGMGKFGGMLQNAAKAAESGNPLAVVGSIITSFIMSSEGMQNVIEALDGVFQMLADVLTPFLNLLVPLINIFAALAPLFQGIADIIAFVLKPILFGVGVVMLLAFSVIAQIWNIIAGFLNFFGMGLDTIDIGGAWDNFFDGMHNANKEVEDTTDNFKELNKAMVGIAGLPDAIKLNLIAFRTALSDLTDVVDILGGGNGPQGLAHGGQVHHFSNGGIVPGSGNQDSVAAMLTPGEMVIPKGMVAANGTTVVVNNMVVKVTDVKDFMKKLTNAQEWRSMARSGTPGGRGLMGAK
jgi:TP901 family phage tail tape measure protein